ncbi:MAG: Gfo/Idh/MocA family oxidoreductase [Pirellulaceae bacterium]|nr:Gfo/Idh/MocA family oxidoreductase [Pirellulaceae bacterium]
MTNTAKQLSRRRFLQGTASLATGSLALPLFLPAGVLAGPAGPGANDRIGIGYIGAGRRANQLMGLPPEGSIVAVADVDRSRAEAVAARRQCNAYQDYRRLLDEKAVDAVFVATPDHWHALPSIHACQAGKDVYLEKPLSLTIREGRQLVTAARKYGRVFQTGSQRRSMSGHRRGCELVRNGLAGKIHTVVILNYPSPWECRFSGQSVPDGLDWDAWCGMTEPVPYHADIFVQRSNPGWLSLRPYSGGEMTGTGAHGFDQIQWALDLDHTGPVEIWTEGGPLEPVVYESPESRARGDRLCSADRRVRMKYANGITIRLEDNGPAAGGEFIGDLGKIRIGNNTVDSNPVELSQTPADQLKLRLPSIDDHIKNWFDCIKSRERPIADVEIGHRSAILCHLGNIARWVGRPLRWDPESETFPGDEQANAYLDRPRRKPYELPDRV